MNYQNLLKFIISEFFSESNFDLHGKLEWLPVTEIEKERYFRKRGKELKHQRRKYKISDIYWEKKRTDQTKKKTFFTYHQILISDIDNNGIFYCIVDLNLGFGGHKIKYEFSIINYSETIKINDLKISLVDEDMFMIR